MKRWAVAIIYLDETPTENFEIEELSELEEIVEKGPDWNTIQHIYITLQRTSF